MKFKKLYGFNACVYHIKAPVLIHKYMDDKKRNFTNYDEEIILSILSENIETMKLRGNKGWIIAAKDKTISRKFSCQKILVSF